MHQINVAASGFLTINLILGGVLKVILPPQYTTREASSSHLAIKEEKEEEIVDVSDSEYDFEVFNLLSSSESPVGDLNLLPLVQVSHSQEDPTISDAMAIQHGTRSSLWDLIES